MDRNQSKTNIFFRDTQIRDHTKNFVGICVYTLASNANGDIGIAINEYLIMYIERAIVHYWTFIFKRYRTSNAWIFSEG